MENKKSTIKQVNQVKRSVTCDYCNFTQVKPDQRKRHLDSWAKIEIKQTIMSADIWKTKKVHYHKMDMCPDCIKERRIHETSTGGF